MKILVILLTKTFEIWRVKMMFEIEETFNGYAIVYDGEIMFKLEGVMNTKATADRIVKKLNEAIGDDEEVY